MVKNKNKEKLVAREKWGNEAECILSLIGLSVGLANVFFMLNKFYIKHNKLLIKKVWKFPAMAYNNGGGY